MLPSPQRRDDNEDVETDEQVLSLLPSADIDCDRSKNDLGQYLRVERARQPRDSQSGCHNWDSDYIIHQRSHRDVLGLTVLTPTIFGPCSDLGGTPWTDSEQRPPNSQSMYTKRKTEIPLDPKPRDACQPKFNRSFKKRNVKEPKGPRASSGRLSLASLRVVRSYLTEIGHVIGPDEGQTNEVYLECGRLKSLLHMLATCCDQEPMHDVNFIVDDAHGWDVADYSIEGAQRLLDVIGVSDDFDCLSRHRNRQPYETLAVSFQEEISQLGRTLVTNATNAHLILICHPIHRAFIEEALLNLGKEERKVGSRIGIISLDTIRAINPQTRCTCEQKLNTNGPACHAPSARESTAVVDLADRPLDQSRASHHLQESIRNIKLHRVFDGRFDRIPGRGAGSQPNLERPPTYLATRRDSAEVWCGMKDFEDCLLWSMHRLIGGAKVYDPHLDSTRTQLPYVRLEDRNSRALRNFIHLLGSDESAKAPLALEAARWVAFSCRLLSRDELVAAVITSNELGVAHQQCASGEPKTVIDTAQLLDLCAGFLEVGRDGSVTIPDTVLRTYILSSATSALNPCHETKVHERIAMVCLRHLQCLHPETIFRPWLLTGRLLKGEAEPCRLRSYSTTFWHEHIRQAENQGNKCLPYLLDKLVRLAVGYDTDYIPQSVKSDRRVNYGLWLCCLHDLKSAGAIYLQMSPEIHYRHPSGETLFHIAAANACPNMLSLLLSKSAAARYRNKDMNKGPQFSLVSKHSEFTATLCIHGTEKGPPEPSHAYGPGHLRRKELTPLHLAASNGHVEIVKLLLEADFDVNAVTAGSLDTPLHLAAMAGHEEIVRCLLHHGADPGERNAASETAWQVAVEEQHTSVVKLLMQPNVQVKGRDFPNSEYPEEFLGESSHVNLSDRLRSPRLEDEPMAHQLRSLTVQAPQQSPRNNSSSYEQNGDDGPESDGNDGWCIVTKSDIQMEVE